MHPSAAFSFARVAEQYARWRAVADDKRSEAPAWWWGPALGLRQETAPMPPEVAAAFALGPSASYGQAASLILQAFGDQARQPWPDEFPETYVAKPQDPAASAEPAAQAASAAVIAIA